MQKLVVNGMPQTTEAARPVSVRLEVVKPEVTRAPLRLCSRTAGRERWHTRALEDRPRLAAAVELVLRTEEGIEEVNANPLTGRVLVRYRPDAISEPVETLLSRALNAGPMSRAEFAALRSGAQAPDSFSKHMVTAEIACSLSHVVIFGGFCPIGLAATGLLLLLHRRSRTHSHA